MGNKSRLKNLEALSPGFQTMISIFAIPLLFILADAGASSVNDAASLLSRFPQGSVPVTETNLEAIAVMGRLGTASDLSLLSDMATHEIGAIQSAATLSIANISNRQRLAHRAQHREPSSTQVEAWLSDKTLISDDGRELGRHESRALAYTSLALNHGLSIHETDWKQLAETLEDAGHADAALQVYAGAVVGGDFDALHHLAEFDLDPELLVLGLFSGLPPDQHQSSTLIAWLTVHGTANTVEVLSDRAVLGTALQRAIALDALSILIRDGHLNRETKSRARSRLERSTRDPNLDIRRLARTTLVELGP
jgi:hypothetical protein